jgi:hypothetical protein
MNGLRGRCSLPNVLDCDLGGTFLCQFIRIQDLEEAQNAPRRRDADVEMERAWSAAAINAAERQRHAVAHPSNGMSFDHGLAVPVPPLPNAVISADLVTM